MNLIFLGPPGSGKGTQALRLEKTYGISKLSTGDMLRKSVSEETEIGKKIQAVIESGRLVSDDIMIQIVKERIMKDDCQKGFILDGFPRTLAQAQELDTMLMDIDRKLSAVFELNVEDEIIIDRISGRYSCANCGAGYNNKFLQPNIEGICDECGSREFICRQDDKVETVVKRLKSYHEETAKLLPFYKEKGILFTINGMADVDQVYIEINSILRDKLRILT